MKRMIKVLFIAGILTTGSRAQELITEDRISYLQDLSLEDILNTDVTSVLRKPGRYFEAPAAVHLITNDDIKRSGVTTLADALRLAPGLHVAHIDANKYAISARGFNFQRVANLLVMIDGRSLHDPAVIGVPWDVQDYLFEDIEQIEVIRGVGGSTWGANALNGVVNIITKSAKDTQGLYLTGGGGTIEQGFGGFRYGGKLSEDTFYRVYAKGANRGDFEYSNGSQAYDGWDLSQGGFRIDWEPEWAHVRFSGDYFQGSSRVEYQDISFTAPYTLPNRKEIDNSGGNLFFRLDKPHGEENELTFQASYDHLKTDDPSAERRRRDTIDLRLQERLSLAYNQELVLGVDFRYSPLDVEQANNRFRFVPEEKSYSILGFLLQDEIRMFDDEVSLTLASRLERHEYVDWEVLPNVRLAWRPTENQTAWAAVSRAVRPPTLDVQYRGYQPVAGVFPAGPAGSLPLFPYIVGTENLKSEVLVAYEVGYRIQPTKDILLDLATYYFDYDDSLGVTLGSPGFVGTPAPHLEIPGQIVNLGGAESYGFEFAANWQAQENWLLGAWYGFQKDNVSRGLLKAEGTSPVHQVGVRSSLSFDYAWDLDLWLRYLDRLEDSQTPSYITMDLRLAWQATERLEVALVGRNLIEARHREFGVAQISNVQPTYVPRSAYIQLTYRF